MLPPFDTSTGNLPPGRHAATWEEVVARFGFTARRRRLLAGLKAMLDSLKVAGCRRVYLDGSFVTRKPDPGDFDGLWEPAGVDPAILDPVLLDLAAPRAAQKAKYGGELLILTPGLLDFFQRDRDGNRKGIVILDLEQLP